MPSAVCRWDQSGSLHATMAFWVSAASTLLLLTVVRYGTLAAAGFVGLWGLYFLAWPHRSADALLRTRIPWAFPLMALLSATWSAAPAASLRNGLEWLAIDGIGVLMASTLPIRLLLAAWMLALLPVVLVGGMVGGTQFTETGEIAAIGIFGSKNNFALHISEMFLVCIAVLTNRWQGRLFRVLALGGSLVAPLLLWRAKSVGALAVFLPSLLMFAAVTGLGHMPRRFRWLLVSGCLILTVAFAAVLAPIATESKDALLTAVGKSDDLTGRGLLWQRAVVLVQQRPLLGVGYGAFWLPDNPEADALWRAEHVPIGSGFHFHNVYYETLVELGYTGMLVGGASLAVISAAVLLFGMCDPGPESGFFCAILLFLFLRSFVEVDLLGGFDLASLIVPAAWVCATSRMPVPRNGRSQDHGRIWASVSRWSAG